jgi:hypothetical protein
LIGLGRQQALEEAINNLNTNLIISGGSIRIGYVYSQSLFYEYDLNQVSNSYQQNQQIHRHPQPTEAINNFNTNTIINGSNISIGRMYSQSFFFGYDLESDQQYLSTEFAHESE